MANYTPKIFLLAFAIISSKAHSLSTLGIEASRYAHATFAPNSSVRYQRGYYRSNGTYVRGHHKTRRNASKLDNFSTRGNSNSFTGARLSYPRNHATTSYNYGAGRVIYTGPRGGRFYINSSGRKVYLRKR